jgi:hypothetical protein
MSTRPPGRRRCVRPAAAGAPAGQPRPGHASASSPATRPVHRLVPTRQHRHPKGASGQSAGPFGRLAIAKFTAAGYLPGRVNRPDHGMPGDREVRRRRDAARLAPCLAPHSNPRAVQQEPQRQLRTVTLARNRAVHFLAADPAPGVFNNLERPSSECSSSRDPYTGMRDRSPAPAAAISSSQRDRIAMNMRRSLTVT